MPEFFPQNCRLTLRSLVWLGVLMGLLFSCGEGIQLFPFPQSETTQNNSSGLKGGKELDYQKNIHRFESKQENYQSKIQRGDFQKHPAHYLTALEKQRFTGSAFSQILYLSFNYQAFNSCLLPNTCGGRAPPVS